MESIDQEETVGAADDSGDKNLQHSSQNDCQNIPIDRLCSSEIHDTNRIVRHIMVIGFHHKHGYQVDYCYPPLTPGGPMFTTPQRPITLPISWKTLPLLCLPDGSHNYDSDTIYFTMPDNSEQDSKRDENQDQDTGVKYKDGIKTIFGTACYRQIHVEKLIHRTDDMTRVAVQKSVCVLSTQPLFGLIRSKLEMITHAYFEELDFSKVRILKLTYNNLNSLLARESVRDNATFLGLSARRLVSFFGNNVLVIFKAMLLEKKILFYKSPVRDLCSTILSMCSLFNGLLECGGLDHSTCDLQLSANLLEALKLKPHPSDDTCDLDGPNQRRESRVFFSPIKEEVEIISDNYDKRLGYTKNDYKKDEGDNTAGCGHQIDEDHCEPKNNKRESSQSQMSSHLNNQYEMISQSSTEAIGTSLDETVVEDQYVHKLCQLKPQDCGLPLQIFTRGSFCLPYLSISYLDLLSDTRVRSFVIGATNFLFKQKRDMYDLIVDMEENTIIINDPQLKRFLSLTVEDLRFMDYLSKNVKLDPLFSSTDSQSTDQFDPLNLQDVTEWFGGDEWIRYHFKIYTLYLLKAAEQYGASVHQINQSSPNQQHQLTQFVESFNSGFLNAWKSSTNNYRIWDLTNKASILDELQTRHPFASQVRGINFNDMKLRLSYAVNSSEKGRMVSQTLNGIGKWSIWNNLTTAGNMAASRIGSTLSSSAASAHAALVSTVMQQDQQQQRASDDTYRSTGREDDAHQE